MTKPASSPHFKIRLCEANTHGHASSGCLGQGEGISERQAPITTLATFPKALCGLNTAHFIFNSITLGGGSKRILLKFISKSVLPIFSPKSFLFFLNFTYLFIFGSARSSLLHGLFF